MELEKPGLARVGEGGAVCLRGARCDACGGFSFPLTEYGCPLCGAEEVWEEPFPGVGELISFVTLHQMLVPGLAPPVVVGEVEIAHGIIEEVVMDVPADALRPGMQVGPVARQVETPEGPRLSIRYAPVARPGGGA